MADSFGSAHQNLAEITPQHKTVDLLEILYPVATVILGGLITSTFCEFLIHPGLFWKFSGKDAEKLVRSEGSDAELLKAAG